MVQVTIHNVAVPAGKMLDSIVFTAEGTDVKLVDAAERIVLLVTGTGLKDVPAAARAIARPTPVQPTIDAVTVRCQSHSPKTG